MKVYNNTIFLDHEYSNAIEYRFSSSTDNEIFNNLTNKRIQSRNDGTSTVQYNLTNAEKHWFVDVDSGNMHLASQTTEGVDQGLLLAEVTKDIDGKNRSIGNGVDIEADEFNEH